MVLPLLMHEVVHDRKTWKSLPQTSGGVGSEDLGHLLATVGRVWLIINTPKTAVVGKHQ